MSQVPASPDQSHEGTRPSIADEVDDVDDLTDHLIGRVDASVSRTTIRARVCREFEAFDDARLREYVPVFVERRVRAALVG